MNYVEYFYFPDANTCDTYLGDRNLMKTKTTPEPDAREPLDLEGKILSLYILFI